MISLKDLGVSFLFHLFFFISFGLFLAVIAKIPPKEILEIDLSEINFMKVSAIDKTSQEKSIEKETKVFPQKPESALSKREPLNSPQNIPTLSPKEEAFQEIKEETLSSKESLQTLSETKKSSEASTSHIKTAKEGSKEGLEEGAFFKGRVSEEALVKKKEQEYLSQKLQIISELLKKHLEYPYLARRMGWQGDLVLSFVLTPSGEIKELKVQKSTGYEILDRTAKETLLKVSKYFPKPEVEVRVKLPVSFRIE